MVLEPGQQRRRLGCPDGLTGAGKDPLIGAVGIPPGHVVGGPAVRGIDSGMRGFPVRPDEVQAVSVPGHGHPGDIRGRDLRLPHHFCNHSRICRPEILAVLLRVPRVREEHLRFHAGDGDLRACRVVQSGFRDRTPVVDAHQVRTRLHTSPHTRMRHNNGQSAGRAQQRDSGPCRRRITLPSLPGSFRPTWRAGTGHRRWYRYRGSRIRDCSFSPL